MISFRSVDQEQRGSYKRQCLLCNRRFGGQHGGSFWVLDRHRQETNDSLCDLQGSGDTEF